MCIACRSGLAGSRTNRAVPRQGLDAPPVPPFYCAAVRRREHPAAAQYNGLRGRGPRGFEVPHRGTIRRAMRFAASLAASCPGRDSNPD